MVSDLGFVMSLGRLRSIAKGPYGYVVVLLGDVHGLAEGRRQNVSRVDARFAEALPKPTDLTPKQDISVTLLDDPGTHPAKFVAVILARLFPVIMP